MDATDTISITLSLDRADAAFLNELAANRNGGMNELLAEAAAHYLAMLRWQKDEINRGVAEADAGRFVPDEEINHLITRWAA